MEFKDIAKEAQLMAKKNRKDSPEALLLNLFLFPLTLGAVCVPLEDKSHLKTVPMPDEWVDGVSQLPSISRQGLELLAEAIQKKGWVSIAEAIKFAEIEEQCAAEISKTEQAKTEKEKAEQSPGAIKLLARAEQELPGTIDRLIEKSTEVAKAAAGVASFVTEKSIWVGKGLGSVANILRTIRKEI